MFSNNKNKKSKELTLQQIIQKSTFRKTIDNLCLLEKKINNDPSKLSSLNSTPIGSFAKISKQFNKIQLLPQKKTYQSTKLTQKLTKNQITARTTRSQKITTTNFNQVMSIANQYQTIQHKQSQILLRKIKESKSNNLKIRSLQKNNVVKSKAKKSSDYLCVKGGSGKIINCPKPLTADTNKRGLIPQYQLKKYQTVVQLGQQLPQNDNEKFKILILIRHQEVSQFYVNKIFYIEWFEAKIIQQQKLFSQQIQTKHFINRITNPEKK